METIIRSLPSGHLKLKAPLVIPVRVEEGKYVVDMNYYGLILEAEAETLRGARDKLRRGIVLQYEFVRTSSHSFGRTLRKVCRKFLEEVR